jgi:ornithine cyclodeaminase/alanine dehydrogenase-like protein (mu-crystallin family)
MRILNDAEVASLLDRRQAVELMEEGYRADARGEVFPFPRSRTEAQNVTLAWMGAAIPPNDVLGFRSYLYNKEGADRGDQVVALYRYSTMELKGLFLGCLLGNLRTGAAIAAALRFVQPDLDTIGLIGTGTQARQGLACAAAALPLKSVWAWSPNPERREAFRLWAEQSLQVTVRLGDDAQDVIRQAQAIALVTSSESPVVTAEMISGPKLLLSINSYRRPEIDRKLLEDAPRVWTDSIEQASGPGTLFQSEGMRGKLLKLADGEGLTDLRDESSTRIVINTGAAWEELLLAESLWQSAERADIGLHATLANIP